MALRLSTKIALCLTLAALGAAPAYADSDYSPYYAPANRDAYQYANVAASPAVPAQPVEEQPASPFLHFNNEVWGSAGTSFFNYKEAVKPLPDSETGFLPSLAAGMDYMTNSNLYFAFDGSASFGNAHYNGAFLNAPSTPAEGTTNETIATVDGKIGQGIAMSDYAMLIPYVDVGFRYWNRSLSRSQDEKYQNFDTLGGLMVQVIPTDRLILSVYASGGTTFGASMRTNGSNYDLGGSGMEKAGGKIGYDLTRQIEIFTTFDYDHFHYAKSPVVNATLEPGSRTEDTTMRVGLAYHFK